MRHLEAGKLRKRMTVQSATTVKDSHGQATQVWSDIGTYWAALEPARARNITVAGQIESLVTHTITLRYLGAGITLGPATHRLRMGARIFGIVVAVDVEDKHHMIEIAAREIQA